MKRTKITWERNRFNHPSSAAGWHARVDGKFAGVVFADGEVAFGMNGDAIHMGSPYLAAQALVRYIEEGGR